MIIKEDVKHQGSKDKWLNASPLISILNCTTLLFTSMPTAALYYRVSTKDQTADMQKRDLRRFAEQREFAVAEEYEDIGVSGSKQSRPALNRMLADARKRKFDIILVWRFDRFARSTKQLILALEEFKGLGIRFISYQENIDLGSPSGEFMFAIISAMAQFERSIIQERVRSGLEAAKAKGKVLGRPKATPTPEEVRVLRAEGKSIREIAKILKVAKTTVERLLVR